MDMKLILGLAVVGAGAYFLLGKKKDDSTTPKIPKLVMIPQGAGARTVQALERSIRATSMTGDASASGQLAGSFVNLNGSGNTITSLMSQIRAREISSGAV